jgi:transcriptional enhancer factor
MCFQLDLEDNLASAARTGRKTTKYKRGAEAVWPPPLERALLDGMSTCAFSPSYVVVLIWPWSISGLQQYFPPPTSSSSRQPRQLQRLPQRNKFISEHILRMTGVYRTAKQVGSRLQQLRETSTDAYSKINKLESLDSLL